MALKARTLAVEQPNPTRHLEAQLTAAATFVRRHVIASIYHAGSGHPKQTDR